MQLLLSPLWDLFVQEASVPGGLGSGASQAEICLEACSDIVSFASALRPAKTHSSKQILKT